MAKLDFGGVQTYTQDSGSSDFGSSNTCGKVSPMGTPGPNTVIDYTKIIAARKARNEKAAQDKKRSRVVAYMQLCAKYSDADLARIEADKLASRSMKLAAKKVQAKREADKSKAKNAERKAGVARAMKKAGKNRSQLFSRQTKPNAALGSQGFDYEMTDNPVAIGSADFGSQGFDFETQDEPVSIGYTQSDLELESEPISIGAPVAMKNVKQAAAKDRAEKQKAFRAKYAADCKAAREIVKLSPEKLLEYSANTKNPPIRRQFARAVYDKQFKKLQNETRVLAVKDFGVNGQMSSVGAVDFGDAMSPDGAGFNNPIRKSFDEFGGVVASPDAGFHDTINGSRAGIDDQFGGVQSFLKSVEKIAKSSLKQGIDTTTGKFLQKGSQALAKDPKAKKFVEDQTKAAFEKGKTTFFKEYGGKIALGSVLVAAFGVYWARRK